MPSRWADTAEDAAENARRKAEKAEKKRLKAEKQHLAADRAQHASQQANGHASEMGTERPTKRRRISTDGEETQPDEEANSYSLLRFHAPSWQPCRSVQRFYQLNHIEEGSYGSVSRAREEATGEIVAIKKLKINPIADGGFPVTALREIQCLNAARHRHIVDLREVVTGQGEAQQDVFLVMEFLEHDLKTLQDEMDHPFSVSEVKTILLQLSSAVEYLHDHWIIHRDLKTSNILMNNRGEIKLADFGMARLCGNPPPANLTQLVVTLWYRSPELLLGATIYDFPVDIWSLGCIFAELLTGAPILPGKNEVDQLSKIFSLCGIPSDETWPGFRRLPNARSLRLPSSSRGSQQGSLIHSRFSLISDSGAALLNTLMSLDPSKRPVASAILEHDWFRESPRPKPTSLFPTFPSKAGQERRRRQNESPRAPARGDAPTIKELDFDMIMKAREVGK